MGDTNIPSTPADGNCKTVLIPTVADISKPKLAELKTTTAVDISCYLTTGGFNFTAEQATITDDRECDKSVRQEPGRVTPSLSVTGIDNTNSAEYAAYNKLVETLKRGQKIVAARRYGKDHTEEFVAGDVVEIIEFKPGIRASVVPEANATQRSTWNCYVSRFDLEAKAVAS